MMANIVQRLSYFPCRLLFKIFWGFEIRGIENVASIQKPILIVANHRSLLDSWLIGASLPFRSEFFPVRYVGGSRFTQPLWALYFLGIIPFIYRFFGVIPISPEAVSREEKIQPIIAALKQGEIVLMFPEGRRHYHDGIGEFKNGAAAIYLQTKALIVPIALKKRSQKIIISIGEPMIPKEETTEAITKNLRDAIDKLFQRI